MSSRECSAKIPSSRCFSCFPPVHCITVGHFCLVNGYSCEQTANCFGTVCTWENHLPGNFLAQNHPPKPSSSFSFGSTWSQRPIGPIADRDKENRHPFFGIIRRHNRLARQTGPPTFPHVTRNEKHQVRMPGLGFVAQKLLLRHHLSHCSKFESGQLLFIQHRSDCLDNLSF